jgi:hypothetical protein
MAALDDRFGHARRQDNWPRLQPSNDRLKTPLSDAFHLGLPLVRPAS